MTEKTLHFLSATDKSGNKAHIVPGQIASWHEKDDVRYTRQGEAFDLYTVAVILAHGGVYYFEKDEARSMAKQIKGCTVERW